MLEKLIFLYGKEKGKRLEQRLNKIIEASKKRIVCEKRPFWDEKDFFLITYPDSFYEIDSRQAPSSFNKITTIHTLKTLKKFLDQHLKGIIQSIHILPFYPYSSDRGFSIIDYYQVKKEFGSWNDIQKIAKNYRLMVDLVLNHVSVKHEWFQKFLAGEERYWNYFIHFEKDKIPQEDLKKVFRPRSTPLLTPFDTARGQRWIWTTFNVENYTDQVDLNYRNPEVLIEIVKVMLSFLEKGIRIFRLDAVGYIWKELGTSCKNLPEAHTIVSLFRHILNLVCPSAILITETNFPHEENITYFGDGFNEAQMVYNFSLPPLVLQAFYSGKTNYLNNWAKKLKTPSEKTTFFNFLSTHDGIGILGAKGILPEREIKLISAKIIEYGGKISERVLPSGKKATYEMNTTWWSALNQKEERFEVGLQKFLTSLAIYFCLAGVPAIYYHILFGSENDLEGLQKTGIKRDINRKNFDYQDLDSRLINANSKEAKVFNSIVNLIKKRRSYSAFHPNSNQKILSLDHRVFAVLRGERKNRVLAIHNVSKEKVKLEYLNKRFILEPYKFIWERL